MPPHRTIPIVVLVLAAAVQAVAAPLHGRDVQSVSGMWRFRIDPDDSGVRNSWHERLPDGPQEVRVPSVWQAGAAPRYIGTAWYWKSLELPKGWKSRHIRLQFGAVSRHSEVWVNGKKAGENDDPGLPFTLDVTPLLHFDSPNLVAVRVSNKSEVGSGLPFNAGGIWQDVDLIAADEAHITVVFVETKASGWATAHVDIENASDKTGEAELRVDIASVADPKRKVGTTTQTVVVSPGRNRADVLVRVKSPRPWSPESPALYVAKITFSQGKDLLDNVDEEFGFREVGFDNGRLTLNRAPIVLRAMRYHPFHAGSIAGPEDEAAARHEVEQAKQAGLNALWVVDIPAHPWLLRAADRVGLMLIESPGTGSLRRLIVRDRSHPSVLVWDAQEAKRKTGETYNPSPAELDLARPVLTRDMHIGNGPRPLILSFPGRTEQVKLWEAGWEIEKETDIGLPIELAERTPGPVIVRSGSKGGDSDLARIAVEYERARVPKGADDFAAAQAELQRRRTAGEINTLPANVESKQRAHAALEEAIIRRARTLPNLLGYVIGDFNDPSPTEHTGLVDIWGAAKPGLATRAAAHNKE